MLPFANWLARWRSGKGSVYESAELTPEQTLLMNVIATGEWMNVATEGLVKVAKKRRTKPNDVRKIAANLYAAGKLLEDAANSFEISTRGLRL